MLVSQCGGMIMVWLGYQANRSDIISDFKHGPVIVSFCYQEFSILLFVALMIWAFVTYAAAGGPCIGHYHLSHAEHLLSDAWCYQELELLMLAVHVLVATT